jgi:hypothetical protein
MENTTSPLSENSTETQVLSSKIYSKGAIMGFSIIFSSIFGGVLLMQNLKDLGKKKEANIILGISIGYTIFSAILINLIESISSKAVFFNILGGVALSQFFFSKYIPNENQFKKKSILKPLIISIIIVVPFILVYIFSN